MTDGDARASPASGRFGVTPTRFRDHECRLAVGAGQAIQPSHSKLQTPKPMPPTPLPLSSPILFAALLVGLPMALRAQVPPTPAERGAQLVAALAKAVDAVQEVRYRLRQYDSDRPKEVQSGTIAVVVPQACSGFAMTRWRFDCFGANGAPTTECAFDGSLLQRLDRTAKQLLVAKVDGNEASPPDDAWLLRPQWLYEIKCARLAMDPAATTWLRTEVVAGTTCEVIETRELVDFGEDGKTLRITRRAIAAQDHLPRRIESIRCPADVDPSKAVASVVEIQDLQVRARAGDPKEYLIELPKGFVRRDASASEIAGRPTEQQPPRISVGERLPDFELADAAGNRQRLSAWRGSFVVLDFWASWCGPCKAAMPKLQQLQQAFRNDPVRVVGMNMDEDAAAAVRCMKELGCDYASLLGANAYAESLGITALPTLVLLDRDGVVMHFEVGVADDMVVQLTEKIRAGLSPAPR